MANQLFLEELKKSLTEIQFYVTQNHGTEPPLTGHLPHNECNGIYHCSICSDPLFRSETKYGSSYDWPSFYEPVSGEAVRYIKGTLHGMWHIEIHHGNCDAHLGHIFPDGPKPTGERCYTNLASLDFTDGENSEQTKGRRNDSANYFTESGFNMNLDGMINNMIPEAYQRLSIAVELGKWPDGIALTAE